MLLGAATLWVLVHQRVRGFSVLYRSDSFLALPQYLRNISRRVNDTNDLQRIYLRMVHKSNPIIPVRLPKPEAQRQGDYVFKIHESLHTACSLTIRAARSTAGVLS